MYNKAHFAISQWLGAHFCPLPKGWKLGISLFENTRCPESRWGAHSASTPPAGFVLCPRSLESWIRHCWGMHATIIPTLGTFSLSIWFPFFRLWCPSTRKPCTSLHKNSRSTCTYKCKLKLKILVSGGVTVRPQSQHQTKSRTNSTRRASSFAGKEGCGDVYRYCSEEARKNFLKTKKLPKTPNRHTTSSISSTIIIIFNFIDNTRNKKRVYFIDISA